MSDIIELAELNDKSLPVSNKLKMYEFPARSCRHGEKLNDDHHTLLDLRRTSPRVPDRGDGAVSGYSRLRTGLSWSRSDHRWTLKESWIGAHISEVLFSAEIQSFHEKTLFLGLV